MTTTRTQVAIVGAGPAGLLLGHLLHRAGVDNVIVERHDRRHAEERIRAGVLEQGTVDTLTEAGVGARLHREGLAHDGIELLFDRTRHRVDLKQSSGGRSIVVYGQHEVVKDLIAARVAAGSSLVFEAADVRLHGLDGDRASVTYVADGVEHRLDCDYVAGCDGFHGVSRASIPPGVLTTFERVYPFAWLGILAEAAPSLDELVYASHEDGFALFSMRSPSITRLYLQCEPDEDLAAWSDARIWDALHRRFACDDGWTPNEGPILQKGVTPMRSFVAEPMQHGRLFLAGDAAHIVPPTGAKGMNLAVADVRVLARALASHYAGDGDARLAAYSATCLARVWRAEHFSWWMTSMLHRFRDHTPFMDRIQRAELRYVATAEAGRRMVAENYTGLPYAE